jgi:hypothetical protein
MVLVCVACHKNGSQVRRYARPVNPCGLTLYCVLERARANGFIANGDPEGPPAAALRRSI